ncbi:RNA recognition motif domain, partial [Dillenia turbinata]
MATETEDSTSLSVQMVGNAFVNQYYRVLHQSPELVYKFYQDSSVLSRPDSVGQMTTVTTMKGIKDKILSMGYKNYKAEIKTADAQDSHEKGVFVLITGSLTGKDKLRRKFRQSFFLAPQEKGYFVLNDVFSYVEDSKSLDASNVPVDKTEDSSVVPIEHTSEPANVPDSPENQATSLEDKNFTVAEQSSVPVGNKVLLVNEKEIVVEAHPPSNGNNVSAIGEPSSSTAQHEGPKKSYASILMESSGGPTRVYVPTNTAKATSANVHKLSVMSASTAQATEASTTGGISVPDGSNTKEEAEGYSIYIRNLPLNLTPAQLEVEFKKYGPIKQGGIQVRSNKQSGSCFGFVEFQSLSSRNSAIKSAQGEGGFRLAGGSEVTIIEARATLLAVGVLVEMSMETEETSPGEVGVQVGAVEKVTNKEVEKVLIKVDQIRQPDRH